MNDETLFDKYCIAKWYMEIVDWQKYWVLSKAPLTAKDLDKEFKDNLKKQELYDKLKKKWDNSAELYSNFIRV